MDKKKRKLSFETPTKRKLKPGEFVRFVTPVKKGQKKTVKWADNYNKPVSKTRVYERNKNKMNVIRRSNNNNSMYTYNNNLKINKKIKDAELEAIRRQLEYMKLETDIRKVAHINRKREVNKLLTRMNNMNFN